MTLRYVHQLAEMKLSAKEGARELLAMAIRANNLQMVRRRDFTASILAKKLNQSAVTTGRHLRQLISSGTIRVVKHKGRSWYRLPELKEL